MDRTVGILGGGQLGRMLTEAANRLNVTTICLDEELSPAKLVNANGGHVTGSFKDKEAVRLLATRCDILTAEIEHVDTTVLESLSGDIQRSKDGRTGRGDKVEIQPNWKTLRIIQDKYNQKLHLLQRGLPVAESHAVTSTDDATSAATIRKFGYPLMIKSRKDAYDGKGNFPAKDAVELETGIRSFGEREVYLEKWINFKKELAVMVVKLEDEPSHDWEQATKAFPVVETIHEDSICKLVYAPAPEVSNAVLLQAQEIAKTAVSSFWGKGVFGVEMFLLEDDSILINEIAPRPHNSGHYTMEACHLSQYDAHLRAILGLPIPDESLELISPKISAIMINILGGKSKQSYKIAENAALTVKGARIHLYGKQESRPGRKMGHVTVLAPTLSDAQAQIDPLLNIIDMQRAERLNIPWNSIDKKANVHSRRDVDPSPSVVITMGSESDRAVLKPAAELLTSLDIQFKTTITSAHRTPSRMAKFARESASLGCKVIIAAAGGAAHLPGMVAANTWLPVIGVPVRASVLDGLDSLLSIVQMPRGCPVATVAINNSTNAAQLAARILAIHDSRIRSKLQKLLDEQTRVVESQALQMERLGIEHYDSTG